MGGVEYLICSVMHADVTNKGDRSVDVLYLQQSELHFTAYCMLCHGF